MSNPPNITDPKVAIVILNFNGLKDTIECLDSLKKVPYPHAEILLIDNGSNDGSQEHFKKHYPDILLIENGKNLGFTGGCNIGMLKALERKADAILLLNNDTAVHPNFLDAFVKASREIDGGIFGGKILRYKEKDTIDHFGGFWQKELAEFSTIGNGKKWDDPYFCKYLEADYVTGCAFYIKKEVIEKIGLLEEKFFLMWEEADYCLRAKKADFSIWSVPDAIVWHKVSSSFTGGKPHTHYYYYRNRLLWIERNLETKEKWGVYLKVLLPEIAKLFKILLLKSFQKFFYSLFYPAKNTQERNGKYLRYRAGARGIFDFFLKRFGQGPLFISQKIKQ